MKCGQKKLCNLLNFLKMFPPFGDNITRHKRSEKQIEEIKSDDLRLSIDYRPPNATLLHEEPQF